MRGSWPLSWLAYDKGNTNRERKGVDSMSQEMIKSERKATSSRENGRKGGRPRTVTITPIRGIEHEFSAIVSGTRHIAYGEYTSRDVYTLLHAPTQNDFDAVSQAMDDPRTKVIKEEA